LPTTRRAAGLVTLASVRLEVGATFGFERDREHLAGGQTAQLVQIRRPDVRLFACGACAPVSVSTRVSIRSGVLLPTGGNRRVLIRGFGMVRRPCSQLIHNIRV
jgi:hypothetical protein